MNLILNNNGVVMKKLIPLFLLVAVIATMTLNDAYAAKRWVLIEEFTNASCGPCASQNPGFHNYLLKNMNNIIPIIHRTSWPGSDVMYSANPNMYDKRVQYYGINGVPNVRINGKVHPKTGQWYEGAPGDEQGMNSELDKYLGAPSPITITPSFTKNGNVMSIKVNVATSEAISNKTLRTAIIEGYHYYEKAGSNGEKKFYYIVRDYLPSVDGQAINIKANNDQDYTFSYTPNPALYQQFIYVVAYIQDDATKEVLQAGSSPMPNLDNVDNMKQVPVTLAANANQKHGFLEASKTTTRTVKITNPNNKQYTFALTTTFNAPTDWSSSINKNEVTLAAGASEDISVSITAGVQLALASVKIDAAPINLANDELGGSASADVFAMHKGTKVLALLGMGQFDNYISAVESQSQKYKSMTNYVNVLDMEAMAAYPADNFEVTVYNFDFFGIQQAAGLLGNNFTQSVAIRDNIKKAIDAGKDVLIFAEYEASNTFKNANYTNGQNFYKNLLGITCQNTTMRVQTNSSGQITGIVSYKVNGVTGDPISNGFDFTCNAHQYAQQGQIFSVFTDILTPGVGSHAIPFLYSDNNQNNVVGIRFENSAKGKLVYISAPASGFEINNLMTLYEKTIDWFMTTSPTTEGPKIAVSAKNIDFGKVDLNQSSEKSLTITNNGDETLMMTSINYNNPDEVFSLVGAEQAASIKPGESVTITVKFEPKEEKTYNGSVTVTTNAKNESSTTVNFVGIGNDPSSVAYGSTIDGNFNMTLSPNPVNIEAQLNYSIANDNSTVRIYVMDITGKIVTELINSNMNSGNYNLNFSAAKYVSGTYYIMAEINGSQAQIPVVIAK